MPTYGMAGEFQNTEGQVLRCWGAINNTRGSCAFELEFQS